MSSRLDKAGRDENTDRRPVPAPLPGKGSRLSAAERREVWEALAALQDADRAVLLLHKFYRLPAAAVARILGLPPETGAKRVLRAQIHFQQQLETINRRAGALPPTTAPPRPVASTISSQGSKGLRRLGPGLATGIAAKFALAAATLAMATVMVVTMTSQGTSPAPNASTPNAATGGVHRSVGETNGDEWTADAGGAREIGAVIPLSLTTLSPNPAMVSFQTAGTPVVPRAAPTGPAPSPSVPPTVQSTPTSVPLSPTSVPATPTTIPPVPPAVPSAPSGAPNPAGTLMVVTTSLPAGQVGVPYSMTLSATGGTGSYSWSIVAGSLPNGLNLNAASGLLSGTPASVQVSAFTVRVVDGGSHSATQSLALTVVASGNGTVWLEVQGLCNAVFRGSEEGRYQKQNSAAFEQLGTAATDANQNIADFCTALGTKPNAGAPPIPPDPRIQYPNADVQGHSNGHGQGGGGQSSSR